MRRHFDYSPSAAPTVFIAFQGWNDVSGAGLGAADHLVTASGARLWADIDPQDYYDFQVNQPRIDRVDGERRIVWRTTDVLVGQLPGLGDVVIVRGIEPSFRWTAFLGELLPGLMSLEPARYVVLGVVPGEVPHTRPFPVSATSPQEATRALRGAQAPDYTGPTGILGVLIDALGRGDTELLALWAVAPQYTQGGPAPKAALALIQAVGSMFDAPIPLADLEEQARAWERGVGELLAQDPEIASYVEDLEQANDVTELPEASGEAIAEQFEQFLRRRDEGTL